MTEVKDATIQDSREFAKPNIPDGAATHIESSTNNEEGLVKELESIGAKAAGHTALAQDHHNLVETTQGKDADLPPEKKPIVEASRWNQIITQLLNLKKGNKNAA